MAGRDGRTCHGSGAPEAGMAVLIVFDGVASIGAEVHPGIALPGTPETWSRRTEPSIRGLRPFPNVAGGVEKTKWRNASGEATDGSSQEHPIRLLRQGLWALTMRLLEELASGPAAIALSRTWDQIAPWISATVLSSSGQLPLILGRKPLSCPLTESLRLHIAHAVYWMVFAPDDSPVAVALGIPGKRRCADPRLYTFAVGCNRHFRLVDFKGRKPSHMRRVLSGFIRRTQTEQAPRDLNHLSASPLQQRRFLLRCGVREYAPLRIGFILLRLEGSARARSSYNRASQRAQSVAHLPRRSPDPRRQGSSAQQPDDLAPSPHSRPSGRIDLTGQRRETLTRPSRRRARARHRSVLA